MFTFRRSPVTPRADASHWRYKGIGDRSSTSCGTHAKARKLGQDRHNGPVTHLYPQTPRTSPTRDAQRVSYDRETVHAVLDEARVVLPMLLDVHVRKDDRTRMSRSRCR